MAKPIHHAQNSARRFGCDLDEALRVHQALDASKRAYPKMAHRLVYHSEEGIGWLGASLRESPRFDSIARQHIDEDLGFIPTLADWSRDFCPNHPWLKARDWSLEDHCAEDARRFRGQPEDYKAVHETMQEWSHSPAGRAVFFSSWGCYLIEEIHGIYFKNSEGLLVSTRDLAEQHILRALRCVPSLEQWLDPIQKPWMAGQRKVHFVLVD